jgi:hypothetical protein
MIDRTAIVRLNELNSDDLPDAIQSNPDLKRLIESLKVLSAEAVEAWKEEIRQSRLHDWEDDDDEVDPLEDKFDTQDDNGISQA